MIQLKLCEELENFTGDDEHVYQSVPLSNFTRALNGAEDQRREWIEAIVKCVENRFKDLKEAPV